MKKLIIIDGSGLIYRGFYAIPPFMRSPAGLQTNAVFGFMSILLTILITQKPDYLAVAFDMKGPTFRHKEYTEYKATRTKAPDELYAQIPIVKSLTAAFGIPSFEVAGIEADDIIATVVKKMSGNRELLTLIATGDFDIFQVVGEGSEILYPEKGFREAKPLNAADIFAKYGIHPLQIPDYKGIAGDSSDNIPGVKGIGDKGAVSLLTKYGTLEGVYEHIDEIKGAMRKKLEESREIALLSKRLATLKSDVEIDFELEKCHAAGFNVSAAREAFRELGLKSLMRKLDELYGAEPGAEGEELGAMDFGEPEDDDFPDAITAPAQEKQKPVAKKAKNTVSENQVMMF
jgi:DNA polymerase-1